MPHQMNSPWSVGLKGIPSKTGRVLIALVIKTDSICCHERTHSCVKKGGTVEQVIKAYSIPLSGFARHMEMEWAFLF
jgi:hypothetical protein